MHVAFVNGVLVELMPLIVFIFFLSHVFIFVVMLNVILRLVVRTNTVLFVMMVGSPLVSLARNPDMHLLYPVVSPVVHLFFLVLRKRLVVIFNVVLLLCLEHFEPLFLSSLPVFILDLSMRFFFFDLVFFTWRALAFID